MKNDRALRDLVLGVLEGGGAHATARDALDDFPPAQSGVRPQGCRHSGWELLEHMRLAQWDILRYTVDPSHRSPEFPEGLWPKSPAPPDAKAWDRSVQAFLADLEAMRALVSDEKQDLLRPLPHAPDASILEEAFLIANHNSYHAGQLVLLRRMLGAWKDD